MRSAEGEHKEPQDHHVATSRVIHKNSTTVSRKQLWEIGEVGQPPPPGVRLWLPAPRHVQAHCGSGTATLPVASTGSNAVVGGSFDGHRPHDLVHENLPLADIT